MADHPIEGLMRTAMENIKQMVDVNTIVGDPVQTPDGSVILPVSKVGFGFAAGGSQFDTNEEVKRTVTDLTSVGNPDMPFGGGSGGGISITPVAFLVVSRDGVRSISLQGQSHLYERMLDLAPTVVEKIQSMFKQYTGQAMPQMGMGNQSMGTAGMGNQPMGTAGMSNQPMATAGMGAVPVGTAGVGAGMSTSPVGTAGVSATGAGTAGVEAAGTTAAQAATSPATTGMDVGVTQAADMQATGMQAAAQPQTTQHTTQTTTEMDTQ